MPNSPQHEMILETTHASGAEEWSCPTCGRRFLMQWPPQYNKVILEPGDEYAIHTGSKGDQNMRLGALRMDSRDEADDELFSPPVMPSFEAVEVEQTPMTDTLRPWLKSLEGLDLDDQ
ncbi:MAG TPA: hypothetical protein VFU22_32315 [Roseiflexaceae bacterium]|nr:hypothetical protein [Roseiflexaceae bacterium]